jgi:hypothetical protein
LSFKSESAFFGAGDFQGKKMNKSSIAVKGSAVAEMAFRNKIIETFSTVVRMF